MHDIRFIRENPEAFDASITRRGIEPVAAKIIELDEARRAAATAIQEAQSRRNGASKAIGQAMGQGDTARAEALKAEVAELKTRMPELEEEDRRLGNELTDFMARLPNLVAIDVPDGEDEEANVELSTWGEKPSFDFDPQEHADIGPALGMDFETGAKLSGARFTFLRGDMARMHRALGQFMLNHQIGANGYTECAPPILVRDEAMYGTDKLPKFSEDSFQTTDGRWLIPTAEVSLTASVQDQILAEDVFPMRLTALTQCFRSEAGSAGKDTRGFIRQHQFEKCELVSIVRAEESEAEHERMTRCAEEILEALELPYRKVLLCSGDIGFGARKTYDLEVWLPGQGAYREISSCSNTGDFQARRMNTRFKPEGEKKTVYPHTLNGSGLAVGRTLVAIMENYQKADGSVSVPEVLKPYMAGVETLKPVH
ncbi:serine--tRNA ligase [Altererythrobacter sp. RZ02]|uniref:Serine--tRNA ligase n=1 Tax=Pontixanthobacter rizhaonensis TaxID=2730337 RepID=A0A848QE15_9SPHN|nr:serine--tRNA ligase [Pontixanthobacter rizhaonensis]NMW30662.1 serine--tRNA ligase [Pontixanthobacter rizhaonensis]